MNLPLLTPAVPSTGTAPVKPWPSCAGSFGWNVPRRNEPDPTWLPADAYCCIVEDQATFHRFLKLHAIAWDWAGTAALDCARRLPFIKAREQYLSS